MKKIHSNNYYSKLKKDKNKIKKEKLNLKLKIGFLLLFFVLLFVIIVPMTDKVKDIQYFTNENGSSRLVYDFPSFKHLLGTDAHGRDIFYRLAFGGRVTLAFTFVIVLSELFLGFIIGSVAGFTGGFIDRILMQITDMFNCIPFLPLMMLTAGIMDRFNPGDFQRIVILCVVYSVFGWTGFARLIRGEILNVKNKDFIAAAKTSGLSNIRIVVNHIYPVIFPQIIAVIPFHFARVMLTESALGFLGLGIRYPNPSWGNMLDAMRNLFVIKNYPFAYIPVAILILITTSAFWLLGEGAKEKLQKNK